MHNLEDKMLPTDLEAEHSQQPPIDGKPNNLYQESEIRILGGLICVYQRGRSRGGRKLLSKYM